jgi:bacillithiol system protein YtxJ
MFGRFFKREENDNSDTDRILLTSEDQLEELLKASKTRSVLLFKHSTSCGISAMVHKRFENKLQDKKDLYDYYFLDLLRYRDISDLIAKKFNIMHQSPQLILIKKGKVVDHSSHYGIMDMSF